MKKFGLLLALMLVAAPVFAQVTLTTSKPSYAPQEAIVVTFANAPGNAQDYIGLYVKGQTETGDWNTMNTLVWLRTDGTKGAGTAGLKQGAVTFPAGLPAGAYEARFYPNDTFAPGAPKTFFAVEVPPVPIVGPNAVLFWSQTSTTGQATLAQILAWTYKTISDADATGKVIVPTCAGAAEPYRCTTPFPASTPGSHWVQVVVSSPTSSPPPSQQLQFKTQVTTEPQTPTGLGIQ